MWWAAGLGLVRTPPGWVFLPRGEHFVTRKVKEWGRYWVVVRRRRGYTETLGLLAPAEAVAGARRLAEETEGVRGRRRAVSARARERAEERYRRQLEQAILAYLDFAPEHSALAEEIARGAAARAAVVGSGRVGRTRKLALEEKAALAARAWIRHRHTRYEEALEHPFARVLYRDSKAAAQDEVDDFLERHRRGAVPYGGGGGPGGEQRPPVTQAGAAAGPHGGAARAGLSTASTLSQARAPGNRRASLEAGAFPVACVPPRRAPRLRKRFPARSPACI